MTIAQSGTAFAGLPGHPAITKMQAHRRWVAWKHAVVNGRPTKLPVNPHTGGNAKTDTASTWATYGDAAQYAVKQGLPGVGFVLGDGDGDLTGIDLDGCV